MKKIPGLLYLEKEVDTVWDEGLKAIESGELELELYSYEELLGGIEILLEVLQPQVEEKRVQGDSYQPALSDKQGKMLITRIEEYITGLFTPKRLEQLREHLNSCLQEPSANRPYLAFIGMVNLHMQADDAVEDEMALLMRTFFREVRNLEQSELENAVGDE